MLFVKIALCSNRLHLKRTIKCKRETKRASSVAKLALSHLMTERSLTMLLYFFLFLYCSGREVVLKYLIFKKVKKESAWRSCAFQKRAVLKINRVPIAAFIQMELPLDDQVHRKLLFPAALQYHMFSLFPLLPSLSSHLKALSNNMDSLS